MIDEGQVRVMQGFGRFEPLPPFCPHVYSAVRAREEAEAAPRGTERSEEDMAITNGGSEGEIPPMHKPPVSTVPNRVTPQFAEGGPCGQAEGQCDSPLAVKVHPLLMKSQIHFNFILNCHQ